MSFHYRGLECKSRKSRNTWNNRQIWPWSTEWRRAEAIRVLPRERTGHSKHPLPTTQEKTLHMDITKWSIPKSDLLYFLQPKMVKLYTVSKNKTRSWLWLRPWTPYCQILTKLKTVRQTTRPFSYDLNQIRYDYTVEVKNRFKGLDLIDRVPEALWTEVHDTVQEALIKTFPKGKKMQKSKMVVWGGLTNSWEKKRKKWKAKEKRKDIPIWIQSFKE